MSNSKLLIFVVDDDAAVRSSLKFSLEVEGFAVRTYPNAEALLREDDDLPECRCIIIDQNMPGMDGLDLIAALRKRGVNTPAILTSGHVTAAMFRRASAAGIAVIEKPILGNSLIENIKELSL